MINLLPPDIRLNIMYARRNTRLLHWVFVLAGCMIGIAAIILFGQIYIKQTTSSLEKEVNNGQLSLREQNLTETQGRVQEISNSLNLMLQVLQRQLLFSRLIRQVGAAIPEGASLTGLTISKVQGAIDLSADAVDYEAATQLQLNLQDPKNKIFQKADILNVSCNDTVTPGTPRPKYPCKITLRALFGDNSQFYFIPKPTPAPAGSTTP